MEYKYNNKSYNVDVTDGNFTEAIGLILRIKAHLERYKDKGLVHEINNIIDHSSPDDIKKDLSKEELLKLIDSIYPPGTMIAESDVKTLAVAKQVGEWKLHEFSVTPYIFGITTRYYVRVS